MRPRPSSGKTLRQESGSTARGHVRVVTAEEKARIVLESYHSEANSLELDEIRLENKVKGNVTPGDKNLCS